MNPQLVLGLGDYSSEKTKDCWVNLIKPVASITKIAIGNHDDHYDGLLIHISNIMDFQNSSILLILKMCMF